MPTVATAVADSGAKLTEAEVRRVVQLVYQRSGITLHEGKRALIMARLQKLVRAGDYPSFGKYLDAVEGDVSGGELSTLLDAIATNHTAFFREEQHFELLRSRVLPPLAAKPEKIRVWCAAASTGEEPATLAMTMFEAIDARQHPRLRLMASDISTKALATARSGVYKMERVSGVPQDLLRKYFEKGMGAQQGLARVGQAIRQLIEYRRLNLLEINDLNERFDAIFCRNVMIYFDQAVQQRVVSMLERHLAPGGYLFIAHSESLNGITHNLKWVAPAVFQKAGA